MGRRIFPMADESSWPPVKEKSESALKTRGPNHEINNNRQILIPRRYRGKLQHFTPGEFNDLHNVLHFSLRKIAKHLGCSMSILWQWIKFHRKHLEIRSFIRSQNLRWKVANSGVRRYINEKFFSRWTRETAYVLGWLITDGCLTCSPKTKRPNRVTLALADIDHVRKIADLMRYKGKIPVRSNDRNGSQGRQLATFGFARKRLINAVIRLGLTPRKSLTVKFPNVPEEFICDFLRGCWEGDGSYIIDTRQNNYPKASFVSGSLDFIQEMKLKLRKLGLTETKISAETYGGKNTSYCLRYFGPNVIKLFHLMYDGAPISMILQRKYEIVKQVIRTATP